MAEKIAVLTEAQIANNARIKQKWIDFGLCTEPAQREAAEEGAMMAYEQAGLAKPERVYWAESPITAAVCAFFLKTELPNWETIVEDLLQTREVTSQKLVDVLKRHRIRIPDGEVRDVKHSTCYGQYDVAWLAFYDAMDSLGVEGVDKLKGLFKIGETSGWWWPFDKAVILTNRPWSIKLREDGRLHCDNEPAIHFRDGYKVFALNGVILPEWVVMTPAEELDPKRLTEFDNAEHRAQFAEKVGMERLCHALHARTIDKEGDEYELLELDLSDGRRRPFLKMINPSCPEHWHVEGVPPDTNTVAEALAFRNGTTRRPETLT